MGGDLAGGLVLLGAGVYAAVKARSYGLGELSEPGAGFFPFWAGVLVAACAAMVAVRALLLMREGGPAPADAVPLPAVRWSKVWLCVAAVAAYTFALPWIGFGPSTFLILLGLCRVESSTSWWESLAVAVLGGAGFWVLFVYFLDVSFPNPVVGF